jgi:hypothetical protein
MRLTSNAGVQFAFLCNVGYRSKCAREESPASNCAIGHPRLKATPTSETDSTLQPMPALRNIRHERFARAYIKTGNAAASYLKAGYTPKTRSGLDAAACRLARSGKTQSRIKELRRQMAARNRISVDTLTTWRPIAR